jgi:RNA polymerase sigma factor (sigma-70 family)
VENLNLDKLDPGHGVSVHADRQWSGNSLGLNEEFSPNAIDLYMAALRQLPVLSRDAFGELMRELREYEAQFRETICGVRGVTHLLLARWNERRAEGLVTGLLAHSFRDEKDRDWSAFIDERLLAASGVLARQEKLGSKTPASQRDAVDRELAAILHSSEIRFEILEEIALELCALIKEPSTSAIAARRRLLGLDCRQSCAKLDSCSQLLELRTRVRQKVCAHNLRLVVHVAKRYRNQGVAFLDLVQEGSIGLLRAVDKFDLELGYRFSTYAVLWVEQAVIRALQKYSRTVRIPVHLYDQQIRYRGAVERLSARKAVPSRAEIAAELAVSAEEVELVTRSFMQSRSLDAPNEDLDHLPLGERLADPDMPEPGNSIDFVKMREAIDAEFAALDDRESNVLCWRFGLSGEPQLTLQAIGDRLGLCRERVRQIERGALEKIREGNRLVDFRAEFATIDE